MISDSFEGESIPSTGSPDAGDVTLLLNAWNRGDTQAEDELFGLVYPELHRIAARGLKRQPSLVGFESEDLLHETFLKLADQRTSWHNRDHFFATVSRLVRRVATDHLKRRHRLKRGNGMAHASFDEVDPAVPPPDLNRLALHEVLTELKTADRTAARVVNLRYFVGLSLDEVAEVMQLGRATVVRSWNFARSFLGRRLCHGS